MGWRTLWGSPQPCTELIPLASSQCPAPACKRGTVPWINRSNASRPLLLLVCPMQPPWAWLRWICSTSTTPQSRSCARLAAAPSWRQVLSWMQIFSPGIAVPKGCQLGQLLWTALPLLSPAAHAGSRRHRPRAMSP